MNLREAAQQALEALEYSAECGWESHAITDLRAALAEDAMQRLADEQQMIERGTKAWADVPDATAWVEELRGNEPVADCHGLEQARAAATSNLLAHFGITSANSDVNVAYLHKQLDDFLTASIGCNKGGDKLTRPSDHIPDATKMIEPVAWAVVGDGKFGKYQLGNHFESEVQPNFKYWGNRGYELIPLYAAPPTRKPLTEQQIMEIEKRVHFHESPDWPIRFARELERAHGIGGEE